MKTLFYAAISVALLWQPIEFSGRFLETGKRIESIRDSKQADIKKAETSSRTVPEWTNLCTTAKAETTKSSIALTLSRIARFHQFGSQPLSGPESLECQSSARKLMLMPDVSCRVAACKISLAFNTAESKRLLTEAITDKSSLVRKAAVDGLASIGDEESVAAMMRLMPRDERTIQIAVINAITDIGIAAKNAGSDFEFATRALSKAESIGKQSRVDEYARRGLDAIAIGKKKK